MIDDEGRPLRLDKAYSWEAPLAAHGMMHMVITNAVAGDPYPIDTLMLFMANMAWNSSMNTASVRDMLTARGEDGEYKIPFLVVVDAFHSEMVEFADLVLPDTTYLERYDCISLLDRPISEADAVCDSIRAPVLAPDRDVRPWQEVMVELAVRLGFPAFVNEDGSRRATRATRTSSRASRRRPGIGFLAGWRGEDGDVAAARRAEPAAVGARTRRTSASSSTSCPSNMRFYKFANRDYLEFARDAGFNASAEPIVMELYSETLQKFRLAGQGLYDGPDAAAQPRIGSAWRRYFDPLPFWYQPLEMQGADPGFDFHAVTQRPMSMYHSWDSQNAWLRQILRAELPLHEPRHGRAPGHRGCVLGLGGVAATARSAPRSSSWKAARRTRCGPGTRSARRAAPGACRADANESTDGFLLNHLIGELLPADGDGAAHSQQRSHHRSGGLVRPEGAHPPGGARRDRHLADLRRVGARCERSAPAVLRYAAGAQTRVRRASCATSVLRGAE